MDGCIVVVSCFVARVQSQKLIYIVRRIYVDDPIHLNAFRLIGLLCQLCLDRARDEVNDGFTPHCSQQREMYTSTTRYT